jgi:hypothetical protein
MGKQRDYLLASGLLLIVLCGAGICPVLAQDTGAFKVSLPARAPVQPDSPRSISPAPAAAVRPAAPRQSSRSGDTGRPAGARTPIGRDTPAPATARTPRLQPDSTPPFAPKKKAPAPADTAPAAPAAFTPRSLPSFGGREFSGYQDFTHYLLTHNALFHKATEPVPDMAILRPDTGREADGQTVLFYVVVGVVFLLAVIRLSFTKYFSDLFRAFFNPTLSQRQLREQLSQTPFPAMLLNLFFALSAGLYVFLILRYFHYTTATRPVFLIGVCMLMIAIIYLVKYGFLRLSGWLFNYPEVTSGYVFTLYLVNKVLGVALLPFILLLAFAPYPLAQVALHVSMVLIVMLFVYRYIRAYALVSHQIFFNKFHFFIYLCGFEIAPVLIIGKLVLIWLNGA